MNRLHSEPDDEEARKQQASAELNAFFKTAAAAKAEQDQFGLRARAAAERLAAAVVFRDNSQSVTVMAALASIYNGSCALPVQLDELRWLDWELQRDLFVVMMGTGHAGCEDTHIRDAFKKAGGEQGVELLHWHTTGGPHRAALQHLIEFIVQNQHSSSARALLADFRSIVHGGAIADLSRLNYMDDDLTKRFILVLSGLWGRDKGCLHIETIQKAFDTAGASALLAKAVEDKPA